MPLGETMNYILYAIPFFLVLIALELLLDRWRGVSTYRFSDAVNSLSAGVLSTTVGLLTKAVGVLSYTLAWQQLALLELSGQQLVGVVAGLCLLRLLLLLEPPSGA